MAPLANDVKCRIKMYRITVVPDFRTHPVPRRPRVALPRAPPAGPRMPPPPLTTARAPPRPSDDESLSPLLRTVRSPVYCVPYRSKRTLLYNTARVVLIFILTFRFFLLLLLILFFFSLSLSLLMNYVPFFFSSRRLGRIALRVYVIFFFFLHKS